MIHSGSRNIGKKIADVYHQKAVHFTKKNFNNYPAKDLSALPADDPDGQEYIEAMQYAQEFAFYNRKRLLEITLKVFTKYLPKTDITREVNIHHNYAVQETHFDQEVWLHRKGAISAKKDQQGIIPGSMATPSYITIGKGNKNSFNSASHGAGRKMSRTQSRKEFTTTTVQELLDKKDIHLKAARKRSMLEEFSGSYKDIKNVIKEQKDLVAIETELHPIMVIIA
jgi:tRNA-splicing ligase RtcB